MLAISHRASLNELVTDVLVERGDREVLINTIDNFGASISDSGFSTLVQRSEGDDMLVDLVGSRPEIPSPSLSALIAKASSAVRAKLEAAHPRPKRKSAGGCRGCRPRRSANVFADVRLHRSHGVDPDPEAVGETR